MAASAPVVLPGDEIIKEVECRVCLEQKQLHIITCGHKLCQDCIGQLAGGRGRFRCPECRREGVSPDGGFPICFISEYLREHVNKATTALELDKHAKSEVNQPKCLICKQKEVERRCRDCKIFLCYRCGARDEGCTSQSGRHCTDSLDDVYEINVQRLQDWQKQTKDEVGIETAQLVQLKEEIQQIQKELEEKQKKAGLIERRIDEKNSLLKVSEFIQNQPDKTELVALVEQLSIDEDKAFERTYTTTAAVSSVTPMSAAPSEPPTSLSFMSECDINSKCCHSVHHSSDNRHIYIGCYSGFRIYDKQTKEVVKYAADLPRTTVVEFDGEIFLTSTDPKNMLVTVYNYNLRSKRQVLLFSFPNTGLIFTRIAISPDYIAALDKDNQAIKLYNRRSRAVSAVKAPGLERCIQLSFSPDGRSLLVTGWDGMGIQILNNYQLSASGELNLTWSCDNCPGIHGITYDDCGLLYASGLEKKRVYILDNKDGHKLRELTHWRLPSFCTSISIGGEELAVADAYNGKFKLNRSSGRSREHCLVM